MFTTKDYDEVKKTNNHSILYKTNCFGIILLFFNYNHDDYALVQKMKPVDFKLRYPDQDNQIPSDLKKKFEISNKFFSICEILNEHEYIKIDEIIEKVLCFDFQYKEKKMLCFTTIVIDYN